MSDTERTLGPLVIGGYVFSPAPIKTPDRAMAWMLTRDRTRWLFTEDAGASDGPFYGASVCAFNGKAQTVAASRDRESVLRALVEDIDRAAIDKAEKAE